MAIRDADEVACALFVPDCAPPLPREIVQRPELARYVAGWGRASDLRFAAMN